MKNLEAITQLIDSYNKGYDGVNLHLSYEIGKCDYFHEDILVIEGFDAAAMFLGMKSLLEPMIAQVDVYSNRKVTLIFRKEKK